MADGNNGNALENEAANGQINIYDTSRNSIAFNNPNLSTINNRANVVYSRHNSLTELSIERQNPKCIHAAGNKSYEFWKRIFDVFASSLFLVFFGWLILLLMTIKFMEDWHNPLYTSIRIGKDGKPFKFHKIRSMRPDAELLKEKLIKEGKNEATGPTFKIKNDPRMTKFGKFIRKTSLDELPQIVDILIGNLSVVGPRSPLPEEVAKYSEYEHHRLDVKGGLLCLWQIQHNRNHLSFDEWVDLDIKYIENRSAALDLKILFKGAWFILTDHTGE